MRAVVERARIEAELAHAVAHHLVDTHGLIEHHALVIEGNLERQARTAPGEALRLVFDLAIALVAQILQLGRQVLRRRLVGRARELAGLGGHGLEVERVCGQRRHGQQPAPQPASQPT
ncbi:hypothetical protein D3C81_1181950 [compost metagenome]